MNRFGFMNNLVRRDDQPSIHLVVGVIQVKLVWEGRFRERVRVDKRRGEPVRANLEGRKDRVSIRLESHMPRESVD